MIIDAISDPFSDDNNPASTEILPDYRSEASGPGRSSRPPRYLHIERPSQPLIYSFVSWNSKSMFLLPPRDVDPGRGPIYFISVVLNLNPFAPLSYITTLRRGADAEGELVGQFELGVMHNRGTVTIGSYSTRLKNVLLDDPRSTRKFKWKLETVELHWDCRTTLDDGSPMCICSDSSSQQLASFVPPPLDASPPLPDATLTVFPDGHRHFDHILLSALVVERKLTLAF
ncbi:hypothetical protein BKA93DRAFT_827219 [Sparassis latifolia]|uniref:DUF6593 domain-containing protein n=1 Tax=Sparassis crispa TaxID=139825 RepID=A0A401GNY7_9APHY|nr:predicted protein [Sparassis crispa]GBE83926.1 predicted protein [Sparassis crispa]